MTVACTRSVRMIAVDIGASSGRIMLGVYDGHKLRLEERKRFTHPLEKTPQGEIVWNFPVIWQEVRQGIETILKMEDSVDSIGVESFSSDFCVFDTDGRLTAPMRSYRGYLNPKYLEPVTDKVNPDSFWEITGNLPVSFSMLCQLVDQQKTNPWLSQPGCSVLPLSNAINYMLSGRKCTDFTVSSTSMLCDWRTKNWHEGLCQTFLLNPNVLPEIVPCGTILGSCQLESHKTMPKVVNVGMHDTAIANHMIGLRAGNQLCINAGTWISVGVITDTPILTQTARELGVFGCGLPDERNLLCRIVMGTWYLQQCKQYWYSQDEEVSFPEMAELARSAENQGYPIDVWQGDYFSSDPNLPALIQQWVYEHYGIRLQTKGSILRSAYDGIVIAIKDLIEKLERITKRRYDRIYLGGGAVQDSFLCELIEICCSRQVICMPVESTAIGNLLIQMQALGILDNNNQARSLLDNITSKEVR